MAERDPGGTTSAVNAAQENLAWLGPDAVFMASGEIAVQPVPHHGPHDPGLANSGDYPTTTRLPLSSGFSEVIGTEAIGLDGLWPILCETPPAMAKQLELKGRHFWILSEPHGNGWKARVEETKDSGESAAVGIEATAETRGAADDAAERKLRRMLQAY